MVIEILDEPKKSANQLVQEVREMALRLNGERKSAFCKAITHKADFFSAQTMLIRCANELEQQISLNNIQEQNIVEFQREQKSLLAALREAKQIIKTWHGPEAWEIYDQHSPEMIRLNRALALAEEEENYGNCD